MCVFACVASRLDVCSFAELSSVKLKFGTETLLFALSQCVCKDITLLKEHTNPLLVECTNEKHHSISIFDAITVICKMHIEHHQATWIKCLSLWTL